MSRCLAIAALAFFGLTGAALGQSPPSPPPPADQIDIDQTPLVVPKQMMEWFAGSVDHILEGDPAPAPQEKKRPRHPSNSAR